MHGSPYLYSSLTQIQPQGQLLSGEHIRVLSLLKRPLQLVELVSRERRSAAPDFPGLVSVAHWAVLAARHGFGATLAAVVRVASLRTRRGIVQVAQGGAGRTWGSLTTILQGGYDDWGDMTICGETGNMSYIYRIVQGRDLSVRV